MNPGERTRFQLDGIDHVALAVRDVEASVRWYGRLGLEAVRHINAFGIGEWFPDRTLVLVSEEGAARANARDGGAADRIGRRSAAYHAAVEEGFRTVAAQEPDRVRLIDASGAPEAVTARLLAAITDLLP